MRITQGYCNQEKCQQRQCMFKKDTLEGTRLMLCFHVDLSDGKGDWVSDGCINKHRNLDTIVCECNHLSMFGVLVVSTSVYFIFAHIILLICVLYICSHYIANLCTLYLLTLHC